MTWQVRALEGLFLAVIDLVILGVGVRIILGAVERGRDRLADDPSEPAT